MADQWFSGETIAARYARIGGFTSGFDYLRILLAVGVVLQHSILVTIPAETDVLWSTWPRAIYGMILPAFFALSGFLVSASLLKRPTVASFVAMRAVRLLPALGVEILLSAIVLGSLLTVLSWREYVGSSVFWSYFLNIVGDIHYELPGVFARNAFPDIVNISLVTIPFELECYIALVLLYMTGFITHRYRLLAVLGVIVIAGTAVLTLRYQPAYEVSPPSGRALVAGFLVGVALQMFADRVRLNGWACFISLIVGGLLLRRVELTFFAVIPLAYATVYLGMLNPPRLKLLLSGDYSYGLYLFAFPIQQTVVLLIPAGRWWLTNLVLTLIFGLCYAAMSWWCIERPILSRKREISAAADRLVDAILRRSPVLKPGE